MEIPENLSILLFVSELETNGLRICSFNLKGFFSYSPDAGDFDCYFFLPLYCSFLENWVTEKKNFWQIFFFKS